MSLNIDTVLERGIYYVVIDGTGNNNFSEYASIGSYTFTCSSSKIAIRSLALTGTAGLDGHDLRWDMENPEAVAQQSIELSSDGVIFTTLSNSNIRGKYYHYNPTDNNIKYYRVKIITVSDEVVYSNVVSLKSLQNGTFIMNSLVQNQITLTASENYKYKILDLNGRVINTGSGIRGVNNINISNASKGMYVVQIFGATTQKTERIIKE